MWLFNVIVLFTANVRSFSKVTPVMSLAAGGQNSYHQS